jgi:hypothetical protein
VYNTGVLFSGMCHLLAAAALMIESRVNRNAILILSATYAIVLTVTGLLTYAAAKGLTPVFFIQGIGPTPLRQAVLGTAVGVHVTFRDHYRTGFSQISLAVRAGGTPYLY